MKALLKVTTVIVAFAMLTLYAAAFTAVGGEPADTGGTYTVEIFADKAGDIAGGFKITVGSALSLTGATLECEDGVIGAIGPKGLYIAALDVAAGEKVATVTFPVIDGDGVFGTVLAGAGGFKGTVLESGDGAEAIIGLTYESELRDGLYKVTVTSELNGGIYGSLGFVLGDGLTLEGSSASAGAYNPATGVLSVAIPGYVEGDVIAELTFVVVDEDGDLTVTINGLSGMFLGFGDSGFTGGILGDADGDGEVTIFDALEIALYIAGKTSALDGDASRLAAADVDKDGEVTIFDALEIALYIAGKPSALD